MSLGFVNWQRYKLLGAHTGLIFEFPLLENHTEEVLVVLSMDVLLEFHSLNLICNSILTGGQEQSASSLFFFFLLLSDLLFYQETWSEPDHHS